MTSLRKALIRFAGVGLALALFYVAWSQATRDALPPTVAQANGRIEATELDIGTKIAGRVAEIAVNEGDFVSEGQVLFAMDTRALEAQLREAEANRRRAQITVEMAEAQVVQRNAEKRAAESVVAQRNAELDAATRRYDRSKALAKSGAEAAETLDNDTARFEGANAAVSAAEAGVAAAESAIRAAEAQVVGALSQVDAATATVDRIRVEIDDSTVQAPRDGRVQYRVAQPGEVLAPGGIVLNLVDLSDVYMTFFLGTESAGRVALGSEARIVLDAAPEFVIPASISYVADVAQFTPKTVETAEERRKLMFRLKARIDPELLRQHLDQVKTGLPGTVYVRLAPEEDWPETLTVRLPE